MIDRKCIIQKLQSFWLYNLEVLSTSVQQKRSKQPACAWFWKQAVQTGLYPKIRFLIITEQNNNKKNIAEYTGAQYPS